MNAAVRAREIHDRLPVVDGHNDLPWRLRTTTEGGLPAATTYHHLEGFHTDVPRLLRGGVGAQFWSVYVPADVEAPHLATQRQIDLVVEMAAGDGRLVMADTAAGVERARSAGKVACLLGAEGGHCIEGSLAALADLHQRGVRYLTLTHSDTNDWADSATDTPRHGGLTDFGCKVICEMNRLGMMVDVSHVALGTMRDALAVSRAPIVASHSCAAALVPHPRNIPDDVLTAIGAGGGVAMVAFFPGFLVREAAAALVDMFTEWRRIRTELAGDEPAIAAEIERVEGGLDLPAGTVSDVVDHIEHIASVAGIDAVGLGSDFDGMTMTPKGLEDVSCYPRITEELLRRSWSETEVHKVLGGNTLRVLAEVESVAER